MPRALPFALFAFLATSAALADEGMWTFNNFPAATVKERYGFEPTKAWLDKVQASSIRLARGCSASLVSPSGLVMTNHHCAHGCIEQLSTAKKDYVAAGFFAKRQADEVKCPEIEANQLLEISDVTARVNAATQGLEGQRFNDAQKAELSRIEKECATKDELRCEVVSLYRGGLYQLYKYRRFQDVRLVFAPEFAIAFFGGDPDNFMFPRYDLDVSFLRLYDQGKPAQTEQYFKWSKTGVKEGDLAFVSGNPGGTDRNLTVAQLEQERDVSLPQSLLRLAELRGLLTEYQHRGAEAKRTSSGLLFGVENGFKALRGRHEALLDKRFFETKVAAEKALRAKVDQDPKLKATFGGAWDGIAAATLKFKPMRKRYQALEPSRSYLSDLFSIARTLVRCADELPKPNDARLREYTDSQLPAVKQQLFSTAPVYPEFEAATFTFALTKVRENLGPDDPFVKRVFGKQSPGELAEKLVKGTKLADLKVRRALFDGGKKAVDASTDPMIAFARDLDPDARAVRKAYEDDVEGPTKKNSELLAKAAFEVNGTRHYPDATFTPRLSFGQVKGYVEDGREVKPITTLGGAFERDTGRDPFALPKSWLASKAKLTLGTPFNLCTTNDIIGGNSGSPVVDQNAEVVGLIFDGNSQSLGGNFGYDETANRAVAVHSAGLIEALENIYQAERLVSELRPPVK